MYFTLGEVLVLLLFGAGCVYFLGAHRIRELAFAAVLAAGRRDDFQVLDQSVHLDRLSASRDQTGQWRMWRQYRFDYSFDGVNRRQGFVTMLGKQLQAVIVAEHPRTLHCISAQAPQTAGEVFSNRRGVIFFPQFLWITQWIKCSTEAVIHCLR